MMNRAILIILLNVIAVQLYSQDLINKDRDSFLNELKTVKSDSAKINFLLKLAQYYIIPIYDHSSNYDTATLLLKQAEDLNLKVKSQTEYGHILINKSYYLRTTGKREDGKKIILTAISQLKKISQNALLGQAYYELSNYYDYDFKIATVNQRIAFIDTAISAFEKSNSFNDLGNSYKVLADLDHLINQYAKAFSEIRKSLEYYKITNYERLEGVYDLFGQLNYARGDYKEALGYELLALKISNNNNDYGPQLAQIENNVGLTLYKLNDLTAAIAHFKRAIAIAEKEKDNETVYGLSVEIVDAYIKLNQPQQALLFFKSIEKKYNLAEAEKWNTKAYIYNMYLNLYIALKQYNISKYYCNQLIIKTKEPGLDVFRMTVYYTGIIKYFIAVKNFKDGLVYLNKNKEVLESNHDDLGLASNYSLWFSLDTAQGNLRSAIHNLLKADFIKDTIFNAAKTSEIKQLEVEYESEKKENDIKLKDQEITVLKQADLLKQANLDKAMAIKNVTLIATILLLALLGILFNQYKQKKKANMFVTQRNEQLNNLLQEKEWLLREVHHRVKNNLQIIISLLNTQSNYLESDAAIKAIRESQERMYAISLIHQKLYKSEDTALINIREYVDELVDHIRSSFSGSSAIVFDLNVSNMQMDVAQAVPLGLILNEAISNAVKYAFPGQSSGLVTISIAHSPVDDNHLLTVADNGVGLPPEYDPSKKASLGIRLMQGLSKQMGGSFNMESNNGVKIKVTFKESKMVILARNHNIES